MALQPLDYNSITSTGQLSHNTSTTSPSYTLQPTSSQPSLKLHPTSKLYTTIYKKPPHHGATTYGSTTFETWDDATTPMTPPTLHPVRKATSSQRVPLFLRDHAHYHTYSGPVWASSSPSRLPSVTLHIDH
ncbi:hypothetical protein Pcinc_003165 [Petrolisthes cinctipes]|uniref:Uncharacterized protein n=1 Tax=Petrolisthes cinctipes TaxID=88211 RepID=A0AAE1L1E4_PETCI|nr:hypothetical protein Pcinc_003165 [Petrolisthes cinctipes]